ncbi:four helix bundle protein [Marinifilum flexuosum]|uniref:four helix bundle protein n=1 Tax=Marinifilum flexuosum TaxID=1117708 RepID=UPI0024940DDD|nr:four helix bundle protein [Marinifilum flexuosum]
MKRNNVLQQKSFDFAVRIVNLCRYLNEEKKEYILSKQLLRAGTSIGANVEEAIGGQSEKDFFAKITIAYKEGRESHYWIRLLIETNYLTKEEGISILEDADELLRIIGSIQTTIKQRNS